MRSDCSDIVPFIIQKRFLFHLGNCLYCTQLIKIHQSHQKMMNGPVLSKTLILVSHVQESEPRFPCWLYTISLCSSCRERWNIWSPLSLISPLRESLKKIFLVQSRTPSLILPQNWTSCKLCSWMLRWTACKLLRFWGWKLLTFWLQSEFSLANWRNERLHWWRISPWF